MDFEKINSICIHFLTLHRTLVFKTVNSEKSKTQTITQYEIRDISGRPIFSTTDETHRNELCNDMNIAMQAVLTKEENKAIEEIKTILGV